MPGYNSTLERVKDNKAVQYKYNVGDTWYIITECSSDSVSDLREVDDMRGQEIRLWKAYENGDTNKMPVVIKGVCLDNGDETEGNIWTLKDMIDEEIHKRHLPTLADDGLAWNSDNVFVSVPPRIANKIVGPEMTKMSSSYANTKVGSILSEPIIV
ncbi:hypothetical protein APHAL10511_000555 [Amanita phalloides]|nr:hypothetical protein APHAL10511_000555 [Amanita phalloides]